MTDGLGVRNVNFLPLKRRSVGVFKLDFVLLYEHFMTTCHQSLPLSKKSPWGSFPAYYKVNRVHDSVFELLLKL